MVGMLLPRLLRRIGGQRSRLLERAVRFSKKHSRKNLYEHLQRVVRQYPPARSEVILNIGSGGDIQQSLETAGLELKSVDIDPARKPDILASVTDLSMFRPASVDRIFMMEVLEHVDDPRKAAAEAHRVLKPEGLLVGSTPFILGIHDHPFDFFRYTRFGLQLIFSAFEEIEIVERNTYFEAIAVLLLRLINTAPQDKQTQVLLKFPLFVVTAMWLKWLGRGLDDPDCTTGYFFVFKKLTDELS